MTAWLACGLVAAAASLMAEPAEATRPDAARSRTLFAELRQALRAEAEGRGEEERSHLEAALKVDPENPRARGLLGSISLNGRWVSPRQAITATREDAKLVARLAAYHERRSATPDTADDHLALALWCEAHELPAEAIAHLTVATRIDPTREDIWTKLGYRLWNGRWMPDDQIAAAIQEAEDQEQADALWGPRLVALKSELHDRARRAEAKNFARSLKSFRAVPSIERVFTTASSIEQIFSARNEIDQEWAVVMLAGFDSPESSQALCRLLARTRSGAVRTAATRVLADRDPRTFLGLLINQMGDLVPFSAEPPGPSGSPGYLAIDTPEALVVRQYDGLSLGSTSGSLAHDVHVLELQNRQVLLDNERIARSLTQITGRNLGLFREEWAAWWADALGYPYQPSAPVQKPQVLESATASFPTQVLVPPVVPSPPTFSMRSCFGAGTLVLARTGLAPIEELKVGDQVLTQNGQTGALSFQPIVVAAHNPPNATLRVSLDDDTIVCTGIHRFWKLGEGWVMARDLRPGDPIRALGRRVTVRAIAFDRVQPVYNLEVARNESFFVGEVGALVHDNTLAAPVSQPFDAESALAALSEHAGPPDPPVALPRHDAVPPPPPTPASRTDRDEP